MKTIRLTQGQVAVVDDYAYEGINQHKWCAHWSPNTNSFYATRGSDGKGVQMSRAILGVDSSLYVDHVNGNTLDNRRENLRLVTARQNAQNQHKPKSSIYPGVVWHKRDYRWQAQIYVNGKNLFLGTFLIERDAFVAYVTACKTYGFCVDQLLERFQVESFLEPWTLEQITRNEVRKCVRN